MSPKFSSTRKSSDAENAGLKPKALYRKMNRIGSSSTLRDSSLRRRNRVISGLTMPKYIMHSARRSKVQVKATADLSFNYTLPTPPASPLCISPGLEKDGLKRKLTFQFPRRLVRPQTKAVKQETLAACDLKELKGIPVHFIRQGLAVLGPQYVSHRSAPKSNLSYEIHCRMAKVCSGIRAPPFTSTNGLPKELVVLAHDLSAQMPTHLLAVYAKLENSASASMSLYPAHNTILSAYCANMPSLPYSSPPPPAQQGGPVRLPVVPVCLPHPPSYAHIQQYLYTKDHVSFLQSMLPSIPSQGACGDSSPATPQYVKDFAATFTTQKILAFMRNAHGMYRNMCALGVQEDVMWQLLNVAWEILLSALAVSAHTSHLAPLL